MFKNLLVVLVGLVGLCCCVDDEVYGFYGMDVATNVSSETWDCLRGQGFDAFLIVRCYHSYGAPDILAPSSIQKGRDAGFRRIDVYMFPCQSCVLEQHLTPEVQVDQAINAITNETFDYFWLDIEGEGKYWSNDLKYNILFFEGLRDQVLRRGFKLGVYASQGSWDAIFGEGYQGGKDYPLWYAHYNRIPTFSDFVPFGGWTHPLIKQYEGTSDLCDIGIDLNWSPSKMITRI